ncbi:GNAT family N-acetyltransferase [Synechococcus sp. PCC 6312]|uniref:GNAT family N-acetyltransferase n=1 Tax=Synechococcus sp. (strain ATCC 27167 / PCC 6312) TaxID=195253 RepID=UPI00029ED9FD|nr:GNAT family N-acetyltransferase [Synechococcus sp. PCC 6312]AFY60184.1 acetyltransferase, ribosomal protein N-acetylase [Synechococcus sp. PCC 6312]
MLRLETTRMILRPMTLADSHDLLLVLSDPDAMKFYPQPFDDQMTKTWINCNRQRYRDHGFGLWALVLKKSGQVIGDCGLVLQEVNGVEMVELGFHVQRQLWGQGLATEAAQACCQYGFSQLKLKRLICLIHPQNLASRRVAEKIGMNLVAADTTWQDRKVCIYEMNCCQA